MIQHLARAVAAILMAMLLTAAVSRITGTSGNDKLGGTDGPDVLDGLAGADRLEAGAGDDALVGGPGNDHLDGGPGNDTYLFNRGHGVDLIQSADNGVGRRDVVRFGRGITPGMVSLSRTIGDHLVIKYGRGDRVTVRRHFNLDGNGMFRIDAIVFANGLTWDADYIRKAVLRPSKDGQYLVGYDDKNKVIGRGGADKMYGRAGDDILIGGADNDQLYGDDGDDVLYGGRGNDRMRGEMGSDIYLYRAGDGLDTIQNFSRPGDVDVIRFVDHTRNAVKISTKGNDLLLMVDRDGKEGIRVSGYNASNAWPIARVEYREGKPTLAGEISAMFPVKAGSSNQNTASTRARREEESQESGAEAPPEPRPTRRIITPLDPYVSGKDKEAAANSKAEESQPD